ncbi:MAG: hypothetical protein ACKO3P_12280, partial [Planctomycetaceae bacterium]
GLPGWDRFRGLIASHLDLVSEFWLIALIASRVLPVGVLAATLLTPVRAIARQTHLARLPLRHRDLPAWNRSWGFVTTWMRGWLQRGGPGWVLMFLLGFQEYELATRLGRPAWTAWLIDALAARVPWTECLTRLLLPVAVQLTPLVGLWWVASPVAGTVGQTRQQAAAPSRVNRWVAWGATLWAAWWVVGLPLGSLFLDAGRGANALLKQPAVVLLLLRESTVGWLVSGLAGLAALAVASRILGGKRSRSRLGQRLAPLLLIPGLLGSLALALMAVRVTGGLGSSGLGRTVIPWTLTTILWLLPRGACLVALSGRWIAPPALHIARLLRGRPGDARAREGDRLLFRHVWLGRYWLWCLSCQMAFFELPLAQLLAPAGMASAPVSLYNQMHYGRVDVLSAMSVLVLGSSIAWCVLAGLALILSRPWIER